MDSENNEERFRGAILRLMQNEQIDSAATVVPRANKYDEEDGEQKDAIGEVEKTGICMKEERMVSG